MQEAGHGDSNSTNAIANAVIVLTQPLQTGFCLPLEAFGRRPPVPVASIVSGRHPKPFTL
jgi:hypothetical protein